jgi:hypothetical protein
MEASLVELSARRTSPEAGGGTKTWNRVHSTSRAVTHGPTDTEPFDAAAAHAVEAGRRLTAAPDFLEQTVEAASPARRGGAAADMPTWRC